VTTHRFIMVAGVILASAACDAFCDIWCVTPAERLGRGHCAKQDWHGTPKKFWKEQCKLTAKPWDLTPSAKTVKL